jgi:hypothetical protein
MLHKSFGSEIKKLEQQNIESDTKIEGYKRKLLSLKDDIKKLVAAMQDERRNSRLTIQQLLDNAEQIMLEAKDMEDAANDAAIDLEKQHALNVEASASELLDTDTQRSVELIHKEQQYDASQLTRCV